MILGYFTNKPLCLGPRFWGRFSGFIYRLEWCIPSHVWLLPPAAMPPPISFLEYKNYFPTPNTLLYQKNLDDKKTGPDHIDTQCPSWGVWATEAMCSTCNSHSATQWQQAKTGQKTNKRPFTTHPKISSILIPQKTSNVGPSSRDLSSKLIASLLMSNVFKDMFCSNIIRSILLGNGRLSRNRRSSNLTHEQFSKFFIIGSMTGGKLTLNRGKFCSSTISFQNAWFKNHPFWVVNWICWVEGSYNILVKLLRKQYFMMFNYTTPSLHLILSYLIWYSN